MFDPMMLAILEEEGYTDTRAGLINRVAKYLVANYSGDIGNNEFREACYACKVDPDSLTASDIDRLQKKLNEIT